MRKCTQYMFLKFSILLMVLFLPTYIVACDGVTLSGADSSSPTFSPAASASPSARATVTAMPLPTPMPINFPDNYIGEVSASPDGTMIAVDLLFDMPNMRVNSGKLFFLKKGAPEGRYRDLKTFHLADAVITDNKFEYSFADGKGALHGLRLDNTVTLLVVLDEPVEYIDAGAYSLTTHRGIRGPFVIEQTFKPYTMGPLPPPVPQIPGLN